VVELGRVGRQRGVHVVDSTVCRGGKAADEGTLLSFVGGDAAVVGA
jgi:3-hydroxyisobutyrate dehydrogenase-like beta-hydroxyacid dehydrogenase